ncbi:unnamed protein product [Linum tenue]|uniref:Uncharacterized protein n=1 Tax=Linum tenue TaxID=586396 RepID=A0AAV0PFG5_9ROSI|nr:unnamed protein product [Linum tenue]
MSIDLLEANHPAALQPGKGLQLFNHRPELPSSKTTMAFNDYFVTTSQPMHEVKRLENVITRGGGDKHNNISGTTTTTTISSSLELLKSYGKGFRKLDAVQSRDETTTKKRKLSTEEVMRVAGERYIQLSDSPRCDDFTMLMHPFGYALPSALSEGEMMDVELAHLLFAAAEKVGYHHYDRASRLLTRCEWIASDRSNAVQRVVHCFAEALRERIDRGLGRLFLGIPEVYGSSASASSISNGFGMNLSSICLHQQVPFSQVLQLTAVQAIVENVGSARKLHCIDLEIRSGVVWTALMQALSANQADGGGVEHLRVTAVVRISERFEVDDTGKRLESFARSINFPFSFHVVYVAENLSDLREDAFRIGFDESVVVFCSFVLRTLLARPHRLENLMRVIKNLHPTLMVVSEAEANHNSPVFVTRFIEALFYYSAYFDSLDTCMENTEHRTMIEATLSYGLRNIVAMEGNERSARNVKLEVWRAFFSRFRMVELGFSESSMYQAGLVIKQFPQWKWCSVEKDDNKGLVVGWKGAPLFSLSVWKFSRDRLGRFFNYRFG